MRGTTRTKKNHKYYLHLRFRLIRKALKARPTVSYWCVLVHSTGEGG